MLSILQQPFGLLWPKTDFLRAWRRRAAPQSATIDEMPESLQRDLGILDGRGRRGGRQESAFAAVRLMDWRRPL